MIKKLPSWCITNKFPAFYDTESATAIEQTARIYGKMNELVESYNNFGKTLTKTINDYIDDSEQDHETFKVAIRQEFQDFINVIDLKILDIEKDIADFKTQSDSKLNGFANDIASFKSSLTTDFANFKKEVNSALDNFDTVINEFKVEVDEKINDFTATTNTAIANFENRVNEQLTQFHSDIDNFIASFSTVTGVNFIAINENKNKFVERAKFTTNAPENTKIRFYNENLIDENILAGTVKELETEDAFLSIELKHYDGSGSHVSQIISNYSEFVYDGSIASPKDSGLEYTHSEMEIVLVSGTEINIPLGKLEVGSTYTLIIFVDIEVIGVDQDGAATNWRHTFGKSYLLNKTKSNVETVNADGTISTKHIKPCTIAIVEGALADTVDFEYELNLTYFLTDSVSKEYVDEKLGDVESALDNIIAIQNELIGGESV